jgi:hypothetical protein
VRRSLDASRRLELDLVVVYELIVGVDWTLPAIEHTQDDEVRRIAQRVLPNWFVEHTLVRPYGLTDLELQSCGYESFSREISNCKTEITIFEIRTVREVVLRAEAVSIVEIQKTSVCCEVRIHVTSTVAFVDVKIQVRLGVPR